MDKETTARAVIILDNLDKKELVTIKRTKFKNGEIVKEYYTIPGGHVEAGENFNEAVIREVEEELGVMVNIEKELLTFENKDLNRTDKFFECSIKSGTLGTGTGPEWTEINIEKYGKYELCMLDISDLDSYNLLPVEIKDKIKEKYS